MAASSRSILPFLSILAIYMCLAVLGDARNPSEIREQPISNRLQVDQSHGDVAERHDFGDPNSYEQALRLSSEQDDSISMDNPQMQGHDSYFQWEPLQNHPFDGERGRSRLDERGLTFRRFPLAGRRPFRFGRPGGCDHSKNMPFLRRRRDYGRDQFPGRMGPDSIPSHVHFDGEIGTFNNFPTQSQSSEFGPETTKFEHAFRPADLKESHPRQGTVIDGGIPKEHIDGVFPRKPAPSSHEEEDDGPLGHWIGWLTILFNHP